MKPPGVWLGWAVVSSMSLSAQRVPPIYKERKVNDLIYFDFHEKTLSLLAVKIIDVPPATWALGSVYQKLYTRYRSLHKNIRPVL